jgi:CobQ-like glutamine amidotransferase family enzyme
VNVGTSIHGPFLPMNPSFADGLLAAALARKGRELPPAEARIAAVDELARKAREAIVGRVGR